MSLFLAGSVICVSISGLFNVGNCYDFVSDIFFVSVIVSSIHFI